MKDFESWKEDVVRRVRFSPDRAAIDRELAAHYEDSVKDYIRVGYEEDLAQARALRDLGDAEEVGRAMDRAHSPRLGWLWYISRAVCAVLMLYLFMCTLLDTWSNIPNDIKNYHPVTAVREFSAIAQDENILIRPEGTEVTQVATADGTRFTRAGYDFSVPYAAVWRLDYPEEGLYAYTAVILLRIEDDRFWDREPYAALRDLTALDSLGQEYASYDNYFWEDDTTTAEARERWDCHVDLTYAGSNTLTTRDIWLSVYWSDTIPEWTEITCSTGEGFSFQLDWEVSE